MRRSPPVTSSRALSLIALALLLGACEPRGLPSRDSGALLRLDVEASVQVLDVLLMPSLELSNRRLILLLHGLFLRFELLLS